MADAAADVGGGPAITAAVVTAVALLPFIVMGDVAGNELLHTAAAVILAGLVTATLLNLLVLPAACLRFGPARAPEPEARDLAEPPSVPRPREEPEVPEIPGVPQPAAGRKPRSARRGPLVDRFSRSVALPISIAVAALLTIAGAGCCSSSSPAPPGRRRRRIRRRTATAPSVSC